MANQAPSVMIFSGSVVQTKGLALSLVFAKEALDSGLELDERSVAVARGWALEPMFPTAQNRHHLTRKLAGCPGVGF